MVIFFHRKVQQHDQFVRCETEPSDEGVWQLRLIWADGTESVERFATSDALEERQRELEHDLVGSGWGGPYGRVI